MKGKYGILWLLLAAVPDAATASATIGLVNSSARAVQTSDTAWTLEKTGQHDPANDTVHWTIEAIEGQTVPGLLMLVGQTTVANTGTSPGTIGNIVVNLQSRQGNKWVTLSSNIANATDGDGATSASIHKQASSESLSTFTENPASGSLNFMDTSNNTVFSLIPQVLIGAGQTRALLFQAAFDNYALGLAVGTPIRAEVIVSFGNATPNGNSTANVDINGNGSIGSDEVRVRSVASRLTLTVPAAVNGNGTVVLTDTIDDITATGDVSFSNVQFNLGATSGTVTANVTGGATGGSITNCAHLTSADQTVTSGGFTFPIVNGVDLQACSTVDVAGTPPNCTPGAPGCAWETGVMRTFTQTTWGNSDSPAGTLLNANFGSVYGPAVIIGGTLDATFTGAGAVFSYLPATGTAASLTGNVQNPLTTSAGELGGEVLALQINVDFSAANLLAAAVPLGSLRFCNFSDAPSLNGQTVDQFLTTANHLLGGGSAPLGHSTVAAVARRVNGAFIDGNPSAFAQASLVAGNCGWEAGEMRTTTQDGWESGTPASLLMSNFASLYNGALVIGGTFTVTFTNAGAVFSYLPAVGNAGALNANVTDPLTTSSGELGGQILALQLNSDLSTAFSNGVSFGSLRICAFSQAPVVNDMTVDEFLATANWIVGGGSAPFGTGTALSVANLLNNAFLDGNPSAFAQASLVAGNCP